MNISQRVGLIIENIKEISRSDLQVTPLSPPVILNHSKTELIVKVKIKDLSKKH